MPRDDKFIEHRIMELRANGHDAHAYIVAGRGQHRAIAIRYKGWWWKVMGGDAKHPSLMRLPKNAFPGFKKL